MIPDHPPRREPFLSRSVRAQALAARASLALASHSASRLRRRPLAYFAAAAILAHLLAVGALATLPAVASFLHHRPPPADGQATIEMVVEKTPSVGGSKAAKAATPQPVQQAKAPAPAAPAVLSSASSPDQVAASSADAQQAAAPAQPTPETATQAQTASAAAPEVHLDAFGDPGYGEASGPDVIPASPDDSHLNQPPSYPVAAEERGEQGAVGLIVTVAPDGHAADVQIASSSGYRLLDEEALRTVSRWHFHPQIRDGQPVQSFFNEQITFDLTDRR